MKFVTNIYKQWNMILVVKKKEVLKKLVFLLKKVYLKIINNKRSLTIVKINSY